MCQGRPSLVYFYDIFWLLGSRGVKGPSHCWFLIEIFHVWKSDVIVEWYKEGCLRSSLQTLTNKTRPIQAPDTLCTCCMSLVAAVSPQCQWGQIPSIHRNTMPAPGPANPEQCSIDTTLQHASLIGYRGDFIGFWGTFTVVFGTEWDMIQCCEDNADTEESSDAGDTHSVHSHPGMSPTRLAAASIFSRHKTCEVKVRRDSWQSAWHVTRKFSVPIVMSHS